MSRFKFSWRNCCSILAAVPLTACAGSGHYGGSEVRLVSAADLPPPALVQGMSRPGDYIVGPGDEVSLSVFGVDELGVTKTRVDGSGRISVPLVGTVQIGGLTPGAAEALIAKRLELSYMKDPQVTLNIDEMTSRQVTVSGEVTRPGSYPVNGNMSLLRAVAQAQGVSQYAKKNDVVVFRTVNGQRMAALYSLAAIERGNYPDPAIYSDDVVVVGDSPSRRMFENFLRGASILASPIVVLVSSL